MLTWRGDVLKKGILGEAASSENGDPWFNGVFNTGPLNGDPLSFTHVFGWLVYPQG